MGEKFTLCLLYPLLGKSKGMSAEDLAHVINQFCTLGQVK